MNNIIKTFIIPVSASNNIGNIFFALGTQYLFQQVFPDAEIVLLSDQAAYWRLIPGPKYRVEPKNSLRYLDYIDADYMVLTGSLLTAQFPRVWEKTLRQLYARGTKLMLVGVGHYDYSPQEVEICRNILKKYPPYVFISRDSETYENIYDLAEHSYDGIDGAYFVTDFYKSIPTTLPPYVVMNFDRRPEPILKVSGPFNAQDSYAFDFAGKQWLVSFPKVKSAVANRLGKAFGYVAWPFGLHGSNQAKVGEYSIIRTDHQINPIMLSRIFRGPNSFAGDLPYSYLNLYSQTELTLSDRIHAVLITLAFGKPAMLFSRSGRASIIERLGVTTIKQQPSYLDLKRLEMEKEAEKDFLRSVKI